MSVCISLEMPPKNVASPTCVTRIFALPDNTRQPLRQKYGDAGERSCVSVSFIGRLYTSTPSPVIADWSQDILPDIISPSAGICSPDSKRTISPTTISSIGICTVSPSRSALHNTPRDLSSRFSNADCEPYSEAVEINVASKTDMAMPMLSTQLACLKVRIRLRISAPIRIFITGSPRFDKNCRAKLLRFALGRIFLPCFALDSITSLCESPFILLCVPENSFAIMNITPLLVFGCPFV